jgi:hypothetical protein
VLVVVRQAVDGVDGVGGREKDERMVDGSGVDGVTREVVSFGDFWFSEWGLVYYLPVAEGPVEVAELDALVNVVEEAHCESTVRGDWTVGL